MREVPWITPFIEKRNSLTCKVSVGIILCRKNPLTLRPEVLLAHKRYTYAYAEFIHGRYSRLAAKNIISMLESMTRDELFDILSLNFEQMWYRIWLTHSNKELYTKKYAKFYTTFMRDDGGKALKNQIMMTQARGTLLWEVPKGRKINSRETDIICATRELCEETGIEKKDYKILPGVKKKVCFINSGTKYKYVYYLAIANPHISSLNITNNSFRDINHMAEISEIKWHDIERIRLIDGPQSKLEALMTPVFKIIKLFYKGRWAARCYNEKTTPIILDRLNCE
jgi:8-oxo-dGTP pyrophosphatase MutT (NUDIX family)